MKNRFFYFLLLAMLPICFASCGSDDEEGSIGTSVEGNWRLQSAQWTYYIKGGNIEQANDVKTYDDSSTQSFYITRTDGKLYITSSVSGIKGTFVQVNGKEFRGVGSGDASAQRLVIIEVSGNNLTAEFYEDYYESSNGQREEYGLLTFVRM